jgi:hypothetical protein
VREKYDQRNDIDKTQSSCSTCCVPMMFRDPVLRNDSVHVEWAWMLEDMRLTALAMAIIVPFVVSNMLVQPQKSIFSYERMYSIRRTLTRSHTFFGLKACCIVGISDTFHCISLYFRESMSTTNTITVLFAPSSSNQSTSGGHKRCILLA